MHVKTAYYIDAKKICRINRTRNNIRSIDTNFHETVVKYQLLNRSKNKVLQILNNRVKRLIYDVMRIWSSYLRREQHLSFIQRPKLSKNMHILVQLLIFIYGQKVR